MKTISLAAPAVRICCVIGDVLVAGAAVVWLVLSFSWWALLVAALAGLLLGFYNVQVFRSVIQVDPGTKTITLRGLQARTDRVEGAAQVYTREVSVNGQATRVIVVENGEGAVLSTISTLNTVNHGYASEIAALELAKALGAQFRPTVPPHLYDRKARRQYRREQRKGQPPAEEAREAPRSSAGPVNYDEGDDNLEE